MPNRLDSLIKAARDQLPEVFSVTEMPPWPEAASEVVRYEPLPLPTDVEVDIPSPFGEGAADTVELEELKEELEEQGFEALALYLSFHKPLPSGQWGVFLLGEPMWRLREKIRHDLHISRTKADILAQELVLSHETYHFRVDLYTLHQELVLRKPLYVPYVDSVYRLVVCTSDCSEESLANRSALDAAKGLARRRPMFLGNVARIWYLYMRDFCQAQPPGYRDYWRSRRDLKERLGGQLNFTRPTGVLAEPQAQWVGLYPTHLRIRTECPQYLVRRTPASRRGIRLIVKASGNVWVIHRYDPDPFPSRPHAHNQQTGEKLDLSTGYIFDSGSRRRKRRLRDNDLRQILDDLSKKWPDVVLLSTPGR